ncbi:MAG: hypothetical protein J2P25_14110 [Nocardiopsaceae bacterium]|nr:hypothetical protein [Nocardiopsaceae bacterium]
MHNRIKKAFLPPPPPRPPSLEDARQTLQILGAGIEKALNDEHTYLWLKKDSLLTIGFEGIGKRASSPSRLVVLGAGGSGKSILLQNLSLKILGKRDEVIPPPVGRHSGRVRFDLNAKHAASILDGWLGTGRSKCRSFIPVPVIFNLSTWDKGTKIDDWMTRQMVKLRYIPALGEEMARYLIDNRLVLPMLDGFDEVGADMRQPLIEQLNIDRERPLILASRSEYGLSLSNAAITRLSRIPRAEAEKLLPEIPGTIIDQAFTTPLMIAIARVVYRHGGTKELTESGFSSAQEIERHVLRGFIPAIYGGRPGIPAARMEKENRPPCGEDKALAAFRYLASRSGRSRRIAWWEIGTSGMTTAKRTLITALAGGTVATIAHAVAALGAVLVIGQSPAYALLETAGYFISMTLLFGLVHWLTTSYYPSLALEPSEVAIGLIGKSGQPHRKHADNETARLRSRYAFAFGCVSGFAGLLSFAILTVLARSLQAGPAKVFFFSHPDITTLLALPIGVALVVGYTVGTVVFFMRPLETLEGAGPLTLLAASRRTAVRGGLVVGIICGIGIGIVFRVFDGSDPTFMIVVIGAVAAGTAIGGGVLSTTAWGQWLVFCRLWLPLTGKLPWRAHAFLEHAQRRGILRQAGGYYQFRHSRLRESL